MKLSSLGEFGLISRIRSRVGQKTSRVKIGIGDDTAVIVQDKKSYLLFTIDSLVEKVHFDLRYTSWFSLGWKALAVNVSDIASMGGDPKEALVSLGLPKKARVKNADEFYRGFKTCAKKYEVNLVGGDLVSSPYIIVSVALLGEVKKKELVTRKGAKVGDLILVVGKLGESAAGLQMFKSKSKNKKSKIMKKKHLMPEPQLGEGRTIARSGLATAMIDNSDGLVRSLLEMGKMSKVGARIWVDKLPISGEIKIDWALYGGEDYNLIFTVPKGKVKKISKKIKATVVGEIVSSKKGIKLVDARGRENIPKHAGYEHFKSLRLKSRFQEPKTERLGS